MKPLTLTTFDIANIERELCYRSLAEFAKAAWHVLEPATILRWGWALDAVCEHLEAVTAGSINRLLINVPPGCMKSLLTGVIWPAWEWGPRELTHMRYLGTSFKQELATRDNMKCRRLIESSWYQERWPIKLVSDQNAKTKFENASTGFREAMSFTSMTGSRGDRVILDDPLSADEANSRAAREAAKTTFKEALPTRINNEESAIVVIMQRLHEEDTSGLILTEGLGYEHLCLPMEFEPERRCHTSIGFTDPRTTPGELLFPERFSRKAVDDLKQVLGSYATAGQLQQAPAPRGGGIFRDEWWRFLDATPPVVWRSLYADTAQKAADHNDWSVIQCWGYTATGQAVLLDQIRDKWEAPELEAQARAFWNKHKAVSGLGTLRAFKVEDKVSGTGLIQKLKREGIPMIGVHRNKDKIARAYDVAPLIESGNVILLNGVPGLSDLLAEASSFPNTAFDDTIDTAMSAISDILYSNTTPSLRAL